MSGLGAEGGVSGFLAAMASFAGDDVDAVLMGGGEQMLAGGETNRSHVLRPVAQISSQDLAPMSRPCVLHTQAMSHAKRAMASTKYE